MLSIPNTATTATDTNPGDAVFPSTDQGALTPYVQGFLFVANATAQISVRRGETPPGQWSPYALVSPTLVPITTDRGGRKSPQYVFGVKAIDGVSGTHAQVFGALFQAGEAAFAPSAQFAGTVSGSGQFVPPLSSDICSVQRAGSNQTIPNNATTDLVWDTALANSPGVWNPGAPSIFTIKTAGLYQVIVSLEWAASAAGDRQVNLLKNGGAVAPDLFPTVGVTSFKSHFGVFVVALTVNDVLKVTVMQSSGGPLDVFGSPFLPASLSIVQLA